jgi:hypothetical protein
MRKKLFALIFFILVSTCTVFAQDTLPKISIKALGSKVLVSWRNEYKKLVTVIDIQRSYDSIRNFSTIGTILNPASEDDGFVDTKAPKVKCYYRVFIAFDGGDYTFSKSYRKPGIAANNNETPSEITSTKTAPINKTPIVKSPPVKKDIETNVSPIVIPKAADVKLSQEDLFNLKRLPKNTVAPNTYTLRKINIVSLTTPSLIRQRLYIEIAPDNRDARRLYFNIRRDTTDLIARLPFTPSKFVNVGKDNDVVINLPLYAIKKYSIKFYGEKDTALLFEISKITEPYLILEKMNFRHSGWFRYRLYSNGLFVEKYKIYIAIDDKVVPIVKEKADLSKDKY